MIATRVHPIVKTAYGTGNFATGVAMQILGTYLVFYSTAILGLPGTLIGTIMGASIFWDAITDPVMGYISDKTSHKGLGRRHPYMILGVLGIGITNYFVWNIQPSQNWQTTLAQLVLWVFLFKTFLTVYVTPYTALGAEMSLDYNERTVIQGVKSVFFVLGLGFVSVAGLYWFFPSTPEFPSGQLNPHAYGTMALASSVIILLTGAIGIFPTLGTVEVIRKRSQAFVHKAPANLWASLVRTYRNQPFRKVVLAYMFSNLSSALLANMGLIVFTFTFKLGSADIALIVGVQFFLAIVSQPAWAYLSSRYGKRRALIWGFTLSLLGACYFFTLVLFMENASGHPWYFMPFSLGTGAGIGALFTLPLSMVADTVDLDEARGGQRIEGVYFGALTFVYKFTQAIALVFIGSFLDFAGFDSGLKIQSTDTRFLLGIVLSLGAMVSFTLSITQVRAYRLTEAQVQECQEKIKAFQNSSAAH